jgi:DNA-binding NarL/FixJ family response regulator
VLLRKPGEKMIRVLIADRHSIFREGLRLAAQKTNDIQVVGEAEDGRGLIAEFRRLTPDVTIVDLQLARALQAIATIRKIAPITTIVALTMYPDDARVTSALALGATFQILKTAASKEILSAVRDAVIARTAPRA